MKVSHKNRNSAKEVLITVSGLNPQIITETLYYLTQIKKPKSRISEVYAITTKMGKDKIAKTLLSSENGKFYSFCKEYNIDPGKIRFNQDTIKSIL